jgi:hypothetical protein
VSSGIYLHEARVNGRTDKKDADPGAACPRRHLHPYTPMSTDLRRRRRSWLPSPPTPSGRERGRGRVGEGIRGMGGRRIEYDKRSRKRAAKRDPPLDLRRDTWWVEGSMLAWTVFRVQLRLTSLKKDRSSGTDSEDSSSTSMPISTALRHTSCPWPCAPFVFPSP